ncbi:MAG TPA: ABC transporter permease [Candidatus Binatia bacterium]|nr:ABC transporter permease [Candidatus Binatia bacterium]
MTLELAWETLRRAPGRLAAVALAVAVAVALVVVLGSLYFGLLAGHLEYLRTLPGDVVVCEAGVPLVTTLLQTSRLPATTADEIRRVPGVRDVVPLYGRVASLGEEADRFALVYLVGLAPDDRFGRPVRVLEGRDHPRTDEILLDRVLARDLGVRVGDRIPVGPARLRVGGITSGGNAVLGTYAFVHRDALEFAGAGTPAYLFVTVEPGADPEAVARGIGAGRPHLRAVARVRFDRQKAVPLRQLLLPVIALVVAIAAVVAATVVAVTRLTAALGERETWALLLALGVGRPRVYAAVLLESAAAAGLGVAAGVAGGWAAAKGLAAWEPRFLTTTPGALVLIVAAGALAVSLLAALLPLRAVARLDPALVFRV